MTLKNFKSRRNEDGEKYDRIIGNWRIIDIHQIPDYIMNETGHSCDFYCWNGKKVYALALSNRQETQYAVAFSLSNKKRDSPPWLCAALPITYIDNTLLETVLNYFTENYINKYPKFRTFQKSLIL
jgi:hypothetical protein